MCLRRERVLRTVGVDEEWVWSPRPTRTQEFKITFGIARVCPSTKTIWLIYWGQRLIGGGSLEVKGSKTVLTYPLWHQMSMEIEHQNEESLGLIYKKNIFDK